jgi:dihydrofolate reductase
VVGKLIYSMSMSLDGYIAGPDGDFGWSAPDEELHRFHNERVRALGAQICGRRLYETMLYWETADQQPLADYALEFARIWQPLPKLVVSTTLDTVQGNARLISDRVVDEVARLKRESSKDIGVGGAGLAATLIEHGLVDEFQPFVNPVAVGGGTPFLPASGARLDLELLETRTFGSRVVYLHYRTR